MLIAFRGVVEDHVEDDFNAGLVHGPHHLPELTDLLAVGDVRRVGRVGRKERDRLITPEIHQRLAGERIDAVGIAIPRIRRPEATRRQSRRAS